MIRRISYRQEYDSIDLHSTFVNSKYYRRLLHNIHRHTYDPIKTPVISKLAQTWWRHTKGALNIMVWN